MRGPEIGDHGHVGYPSLEDRGHCHGDLASFEYVYKGYAALGYLPKELEAIRAFLTAHRQHDVGLFLEGEEYAQRFPPLTVASSKKFEFADENGFDRVLFELACNTCDHVYRTATADLLALEPRPLSAQQVGEFTSRVLEAETENFHRCFGLLHPSGTEIRRLREFLRDHGQHQVTARTVAEEEWRAGAAAPSLRLLWSYGEGQVFRELPIVADDGFIYAPLARPAALACIAADGREVWQLSLGPELGHGGNDGLAVTGDRLILTPYSADKDKRELWVIDRRTGEVEQRTAFPFYTFRLVPGGQRMIAVRHEWTSTTESEIARFDPSNPREPVWSHTDSGNILTHKSFRQFAVDAGHVYTLWHDTVVALRLSDGEVAWRQSLPELEGRALVNTPASVINDTFLLGVTGQLIALNTADGEERWRQPIAGWPRVIHEGVVYAAEIHGSPDEVKGGVFAFDVESGRPLAQCHACSEPFFRAPLPHPRFSGSLAIGRTHVFAGDSDERIWALDRATLQPDWMIRPRPQCSVALAYEDRVLARGAGGRLLCFAAEG